MDFIYSRHRLRSKKRKWIKIIFLLIISFFTFCIMLKSVSPIFDELCIEKINNMVNTIINEETGKVLNNLDYTKMVVVEKNEFNNTNIVKTDVVLVNQIVTDIALRIEEKFKNLENEKIKIPIGALTGNNLLAGTGPNIKISFIKTGNLSTEIKTEFKEQGINQTIYRLYLELKASVKILTPYKTINKEITNQVLLVESVIVGNVPETYYNLKGIDDDGSLNLVN